MSGLENDKLPHTRKTVQKHRGLVLLIVVLIVVWLMEPGLKYAADQCRDLIFIMFGAEP